MSSGVYSIEEVFFDARRKDEDNCHGDYPTKRVIYEISAALAAATQSGQPYQTRFTPPPASPDVLGPAIGR
jgi:hypothetical protein